METYQKEREQARKSLMIADHVLTQTYPLVKDPKILTVVVDNLHRATEHAVSAILGFDRLHKKIPPFHDSFADKTRVFRSRNRRRYDFKEEYLDLITTLQDLVQERIRAPVEFSRRESYVIADEEYKLSKLTAEKLKRKLELAKLFIEDMERWIRDHERTIR
ncbi:MAG: hypothetical protein GXP63_05755 [DPANN group archaeon]|nr:hypothetical protein [DPANN group archaeon]